MTASISKKLVASIPAIVLLFFFSIISGLREGGLDYDRYVIMIKNTVAGASLFDKLLLAKDPLFGFIVHLLNPSTDDEYFKVFLSFSILGFLGKLTIRNELGYGFSVFVVLYLFFMAPSLDYAAIRAMVGLTFLIAAFKYHNKNFTIYCLFSVLSVAAHVSMLVPLILGTDFSRRIVERRPILVLLLIVFCSFSSKFILSYFPNTSTYIDESGTLASILPISISISAVFMYWLLIFRVYHGESSELHKKTFYVSVVLFLGSLFLAPVVVVAAYRFHQIAQFVFLIALLTINHRFLLERKQRLLSLILVFILFSVPMIYKNYSQELWSIMIENTSLFPF